MARWRFWTAHSIKWPMDAASPVPPRKDVAAGILWPVPAKVTVRIKDPGSPYFVDVEVYADPDEPKPVVTGIAIRTAAALDPDAEGVDWQEGADFEAVSPRDARRLPLSTYVDAAIAIVSNPFQTEGDDKLRRVLLPKGRPGGPRTMNFYEEIAEMHRQLEARGGPARPVQAIAERMSVRLGEDVPENRVHQWLNQAREYGFLARPQTSGNVTRSKSTARKTGRAKGVTNKSTSKSKSKSTGRKKGES